jgi:hypothetical protein
MSNMLKTWVISHMCVLHHGMVWCWCTPLFPAIVSSSSFFVVVVITIAALVCEVLRSFVFVSAAVLYYCQLAYLIPSLDCLRLHIESDR